MYLSGYLVTSFIVSSQIGSCFFLLRCTESCTKSVQERHGPVGAGPEEGHRND